MGMFSPHIYKPYGVDWACTCKRTQVAICVSSHYMHTTRVHQSVVYDIYNTLFKQNKCL